MDAPAGKRVTVLISSRRRLHAFPALMVGALVLGLGTMLGTLLVR